MFSIVTDTSADLPADAQAKNDITVIPLTYCVDGQEFFCPTDGSYDAHAFFTHLRAKHPVTTSLIPPERYIQAFDPILRSGRDVLFIGLSSGVSSSFQSAVIAGRILEEDYPDRRVRLFDSYGASLGVGLLCLYAAECRKTGLDIEETLCRLEKRRSMLYQIITVGDLFFLNRTGRLSLAKATIGSALHLRPLLKGDPNGKLVIADKARGRKNALQALADKCVSLVKNPEEQTIGIAHADCPDDAKTLKRLLQRALRPRHILTVCIDPVLGAHVGPDTLALFFLADERVRYH